MTHVSLLEHIIPIALHILNLRSEETVYWEEILAAAAMKLGNSTNPTK